MISTSCDPTSHAPTSGSLQVLRNTSCGRIYHKYSLPAVFTQPRCNCYEIYLHEHPSSGNEYFSLLSLLDLVMCTSLMWVLQWQVMFWPDISGDISNMNLHPVEINDISKPNHIFSFHRLYYSNIDTQ